MTWKAHAKINLHLKITGRLMNGFHSLDTVFQEIDLHDELVWEPAMETAQEPRPQSHRKARPLADFELRVEGADLGPMESNLVYKAARLFSEASNICLKGKLTLKKKTPHGGGLGGGSSDAACTLINLNQFHKNPLSPLTCHQLACQLGSDVPFFLKGGSCHGKGRGEILESIKLPEDMPSRGFLFLPHSSANTVDVFRAFAKKRPAIWKCPPGLHEPIQWGKNDLTEPASSIYPDIAHMHQIFNEYLPDEKVFMSGSGSTWVWLTGQNKVPPLPFKIHVKTVPFKFQNNHQSL